MRKEIEKQKQPNIECPRCEGYGKLQRNPEFKEPYGYPYRPASIDCDICKGVGWIYATAKDMKDLERLKLE